MKKLKKKIKKYMQRHDPLRATLTSLCVFFVLCGTSKILRLIYFYLQQVCPNILSIIDASSVNFTFVSIPFTILGFGVTLKNIILSKDSVTYNLFTLKALIEEGNSLVSSISWYLILCIPFYSVIIYALGYRRQLYFFLLVSSSAFIIHFFTILIRLRKKNCKKIVAYIIINNLFDKDKRTTEYRKEVFQKLVNSDESKAESNMIFADSVDILSDIITNEEPFICSNRHILTKTVIQKKIKENWDDLDADERNEFIKVFSLYVFDYFNSIIKDSNITEYDYLIVQFNRMITHYTETHFKEKEYIKYYLHETQNKILVTIGAKPDESYTPSIKKFKKSRKKEFLSNYANLYMLYLNYILGLLSACIINMRLKDIKDIKDFISSSALKQNIFLSNSIINLLTLYILYYASKNYKLSPDISYQELSEYINDLIANTSFLYSEYIESQLFRDFTVFDYMHYIHEIYEKIHNDKNHHTISVLDFEEDTYE